ncbi:hypothetical protein M9Y10_003910 [Tritrichomonas musculus]|uniref:Ankyrin repeat protein n=1 Tax=Tritrichomonas musculus TaxID=1915356 RepID=A0ABR2JQJ7_9EUKA
MVKLFVDKKETDINADDGMENVIHSAVNPYYVTPKNEIVKLILDRDDLNYNCKDKTNENSPLHIAVEKCSLFIVNLLVNKPKIEINSRNKILNFF